MIVNWLISNGRKGREGLRTKSSSTTTLNNNNNFRSKMKKEKNLNWNRSLFVTTQATPNPDSLKFIPGERVLTGENNSPTTLDFPSARTAHGSPLAKSLFKIDGVKGVFFGSDFVTITKDRNTGWNQVRSSIFAAIGDFYESGKPILSGELPPQDTQIQPHDSEIVQMIKEILETKVRPAVQEDGGDIVYKGFEDGIVLLQMQGSCSGCPSSSVTLKNGIEKMLMHWIPEVNGVIAVDDEELEKVNMEAFSKVEEKN
eukprot:TRINITY_DN3092_c0_g1_i3.p1 TRINITY_DN3092_c0_g1~~TRINITY_DN3092_c0_g1_i3.p1  ORF type:complete len:257 (+),score=83.60 TRINITY_DN3092_c0_g1_i3:96-866(+)